MADPTVRREDAVCVLPNCTCAVWIRTERTLVTRGALPPHSFLLLRGLVEVPDVVVELWLNSDSRTAQAHAGPRVRFPSTVWSRLAHIDDARLAPHTSVCLGRRRCTYSKSTTL